MAAPVTDPAVLQIEPGDRFLSGLRAGLEARPQSHRFLIGAGSVPDAMLGQAEPLAVVAEPVSDTCKEVREGLVLRTVPRDNLVIVTGPWLVSRQALKEALDRAATAGAGDAVGLFRGSRLPIRVFLKP